MASSVVIETPGNPDLVLNPSSSPPAFSLPFQLYFHILEARHLEVSEADKVNTLVDFSFERDGICKQKASTRVFKDSPNPHWHEEWVMARGRGGVETQKMRFEVYAHRWLRSNELIGEAVVDVKALKAGEVHEMTLVLREREVLEKGVFGEEMKSLAKGKVMGELLVMIEKTELLEDEGDKWKKDKEAVLLFKRLSSLRVVLEKLSYYPGETVRGMVIWNVGSEKKVRALRIHAIGETNVHWSESRGNNRTDHYHGKHTYFDMTTTLYGNGKIAGQGDEIKVGNEKFCFPFSFPLPIRIPSSFAAITGNTRYHITAYADRRLALNKCSKVDFQVLNAFCSSIPTAISISAGQETHSLITKNALAIPFSVSAPSVGKAGQIISVSCSINNSDLTSKPIKAVTINLVQWVTFYAAHASAWKSRDVPRTLSSVSLVPCARPNQLSSSSPSSSTHTTLAESALPIFPGQKRTFELSLEIPALTPPTTPQQISPVLSVTYYIEATFETEGNFFTVATNKKQVPIVISRPTTLPPYTLADPPSLKIPGDCSMNVDGTVVKMEWSSFVPAITQLSPIIQTSQPILGNPNNGLQGTQSGNDGFERQEDEISKSNGLDPSIASETSGMPQNQLEQVSLPTSKVMMTPVVGKKGAAPITVPFMISTFQSISPSFDENGSRKETRYDDSAVTFVVNPRLVKLPQLWQGYVPNPTETMFHLNNLCPIIHSIHQFNSDQSSAPIAQLNENQKESLLLQSISGSLPQRQAFGSDGVIIAPDQFIHDIGNENGTNQISSPSYPAPPMPNPQSYMHHDSSSMHLSPYQGDGQASVGIAQKETVNILTIDSFQLPLIPSISGSPQHSHIKDDAKSGLYPYPHQETDSRIETSDLNSISYSDPSHNASSIPPAVTYEQQQNYQNPPSYHSLTSGNSQEIQNLGNVVPMTPPHMNQIQQIQQIPQAIQTGHSVATLALNDTMITVWAVSSKIPSFSPFLAPIPISLSPIQIPILSSKLPNFPLLAFGGESVESLADDLEWTHVPQDDPLPSGHSTTPQDIHSSPSTDTPTPQ